MVRGREKFQKYKQLIDALVLFYAAFPKSIQKKLLIQSRKMTGNIGMAVRYALLKNLAKFVGENVSIHSDVYLFNVENLSIGNNVSIHPMCYIEAYGKIFIGDDVSIAHNVTLMSVNHSFSDSTVSIKDQPVEKRPIKIGNNIWIGAKATILGNVNINDGVVVGAGAVVTKSVAENTVVAGVPAKVIKLRGK